MSNQNYEVNDIIPYLDSFRFFLTIKIMEDTYNKIYSQEQNIINLSDYIKEKTNNDILNEETLKKSPRKAFDYLLDELHKKFKKEDGEQNNYIKSAEINKENAAKLFKDFMANDKSYISENFFGVKLLSKKCQSCHMTQYLYKYLKTIQINIIDMNEDRELNLEKCLKTMVNSTTKKNEFCPICSSNRDLEISFEIIKCPKMMIIILQTNKDVKYRIKKTFIHRKYKLIAAETKNSNINLGILDKLVNICSKSNEYRFIDRTQLDENIFKKELPIVLFYNKSQDNYNFQNNNLESNESFFLEKEKVNNIDIISENIVLSNIKNGSLIQSYDKSNKTNAQEEKEIILYFKIEKNEKGMYIYTSNITTFSIIIQELEKKYELEEPIDYKKLFFNDINIDIKKTPRDYKIPTESHIYIKN